MSRHHYSDFVDGCRRRDPIIPVAYLTKGWRRPAFWHGRARHRVIDGFKPKMSRTIRENHARREKIAQGAAEMCVMAVEAVRRGGMFHFEGNF